MANRKACKVLEVPSATLIYLLTFYVYCHILPKKIVFAVANIFFKLHRSSPISPRWQH